ncbi:hypothetical protein TCAL_16990 [Tigriopus californicus]|uniref:PPM-type phosphatase domain-containing protein n=1 Tax=Tigriopus californicus TaxID=6832 RepID=A0A553PGM8_TIGCA|nr:hypothetical protein TCAL_16990 [Tigriopus californicus]
MGTDGFWDVMSNTASCQEISKMAGKTEQEMAESLVAYARGERSPEMCWIMPNKRLASGDDITAMVVSLHKARHSKNPTL